MLSSLRKFVDEFLYEVDGTNPRFPVHFLFAGEEPDQRVLLPRQSRQEVLFAEIDSRSLRAMRRCVMTMSLCV